MKVKIKSILNVIGHEELYVIPITSSGKYLLGLNFYEDIEGGRVARFVLILDKYGEITSTKVIEGDKGVVLAEGIKEDMEKLSKIIKIEKKMITNRIPLFVNIKVKNSPETQDRGIKGYENYVKRYGEIQVSKLTGQVTLDVIEETI
ncbi:hypothetical protein [Acidianus sp. HS-5]|uniref:hypothetical protein n=1 Tax=Acidianus sp. HS-5 TaxID=2886040 RepID=UPI001F246CB4|nr:hypothetical protein [Acidianus sp. HS-5]BDC18158.1 hypothetical protein HS5_10480 [Acidianus sp. HS-5]